MIFPTRAAARRRRRGFNVANPIFDPEGLRLIAAVKSAQRARKSGRSDEKARDE
jgi:hypothetical protein